MYGIFGREIMEYIQSYVVYIRLWSILEIMVCPTHVMPP